MAIGTITRLSSRSRCRAVRRCERDGARKPAAGLDLSFRRRARWPFPDLQRLGSTRAFRPLHSGANPLVAVMGEERVASMPEPEIVEVAIHNYLIP